jgi:hypothetical protein
MAGKKRRANSELLLPQVSLALHGRALLFHHPPMLLMS